MYDMDMDIEIVVDFILGYWPGLEDGISWGDDLEKEEVYQAARRLKNEFYIREEEECDGV